MSFTGSPSPSRLAALFLSLAGERVVRLWKIHLSP